MVTEEPLFPTAMANCKENCVESICHREASNQEEERGPESYDII